MTTSHFKPTGQQERVVPHDENEDSDTIFALSSGQGRAGVAVIRISGASAYGCLEAMTPNQVGMTTTSGTTAVTLPLLLLLLMLSPRLLKTLTNLS